MKAIIQKSEVDGKIVIPPSKSYTHRALICATLAKGKSRIISSLISDDTEATVKILRKLGINIKESKGFIEIEGGTLREPKEDLFCGESGTTMRLMTAVCSLVDGKCRLTGGTSLSKRPIKPLVDALKQLGVKCSCNGKFPPVIVEKGLMGGKTEIPGDISSQFVSALLLIAPFAKKGVEIKLTTPLESKPYVLMTLETLREFGIKVETSEDLQEFHIEKQDYKPNSVKIEGDWSSAAFLLVAGAIAGEVEVENLNMKSLQADRGIIRILREMGARIKIENKSIVVKKSELSAIEVDVSDNPDLFPILCVLSTLAKGNSKITGIERLRIKESDRVASIKEGLIHMGVRVVENNNEILIDNSKPQGTIIDPKNDHRIAMAFAILGLIAEGKTVIKNAECVSKSFPSFWDVLQKMNAKVKIHE